jgi:hypothetical protein
MEEVVIPPPPQQQKQQQQTSLRVSTGVAEPVVIEGWLYKVAFLSVMGLVQMIVIVANYGYPITDDWGALLLPIWLVLAAVLVYFVVRCYRAAMQQERYHHPIIYLMFSFLFWVAALIFFILLAVQLNQYASGTAPIDGVQLVDVWLIFLAVFSFVSLGYIVWRCCNRNEIALQQRRLIDASGAAIE